MHLIEIAIVEKVLMGSFTQEIPASQIVPPPGCGENNTTMLFHMSGPEMFKCRPKEITSILSEKEIHRPVASQARSARIAKKRRLRDLESDSTGAESEDDFVMSNRWGEATHMLCVWMARLSYLLFILPYSFIVFLLEARTMRTLVSLEMTWKKKTHRVIEGAWTVCLTPNIPLDGWRTGNLSGSYTRAKNNLNNNRGAPLRKTVTRRQVSLTGWCHFFKFVFHSLFFYYLCLSSQIGLAACLTVTLTQKGATWDVASSSRSTTARRPTRQVVPRLASARTNLIAGQKRSISPATSVVVRDCWRVQHLSVFQANYRWSLMWQSIPFSVFTQLKVNHNEGIN